MFSQLRKNGFKKDLAAPTDFEVSSLKEFNIQIFFNCLYIFMLYRSSFCSLDVFFFFFFVNKDNRALLHSNKQWRRVEIRVDKNTTNV